MKSGVIEKVDDENREEVLLKQKVLELLETTRNKVYNIFEESGFDAAFFDIDIDFKVGIDHTTIRVREREKRVEL